MFGARWSSKAKVYGLGPEGYKKVREGANGFSCHVRRSFIKRTQTTVEPTFFDAEGSRANMIRRMSMEELRASGKYLGCI
jgi:hypothetical protein